MSLEHRGEQCDFCGEPVDNLAGNPGKWSLGFPRPDMSGITRAHHIECVMQRLVERDALKAENERLLAALKEIAGSDPSPMQIEKWCNWVHVKSRDAVAGTARAVVTG